MKELKIEIEFSPAETVKISEECILVYPDQYIPTVVGNLGPMPNGKDFTFCSAGAHFMERDRRYEKIFDTYEEAYEDAKNFVEKCKKDFEQLWKYNKE